MIKLKIRDRRIRLSRFTLPKNNNTEVLPLPLVQQPGISSTVAMSQSAVTNYVKEVNSWKLREV